MININKKTDNLNFRMTTSVNCKKIEKDHQINTNDPFDTSINCM